MTATVRPRTSSVMADCTVTSLRASSRTTGASLSSARAMETRCRSPPERVDPPSPRGGVEAPGQRLDEVERRRAPGGLAHLLVGGVGPDHADVVRDGALEEGHVLEHDRHAGEHLVRVEPPLVGAAEQHAPRARVPEARREPADGGLARSGGPHERRSLPSSRGSVAPRAVGDLIDGMGAQPVPVRPAPFEYSACAAALSVGKLMFIAFFKRLCQNMELVL